MIDLRSDTVTKPTAAMRRAMAEAEVGDDERDGDPTVKKLEERVAEMLGKERAMFFPSGVMANQTGIRLLSRRGTEMLIDANSHIVHLEIAAAADLSGVQARTVTPGCAGDREALVMSAADLRASFRPPSRFTPKASLVSVENTHNGAGGVIYPLAELRALREEARSQALPVHLDGARLWNASIASGTSLKDFAACGETVMVDFSKGLGAPVGAALAFADSFWDEAWAIRKRMGGAMRQSGILGAAAIYALDNNLERLAEDHENARQLAAVVSRARGARVVPPQTNIVMIDLPTGLSSGTVLAAAAKEGVRLSQWSPTRIRTVTHLDVSRSDVIKAGELLVKLIEEHTGSS